MSDRFPLDWQPIAPDDIIVLAGNPEPDEHGNYVAIHKGLIPDGPSPSITPNWQEVPWTGLSIGQMCDTISWVWSYTGFAQKTPEEIFNYSPTGELWKIFDWFTDAQDWLIARYPSRL